VSIVVPTFARPRELRGCLDAISRLDRAGLEVEVIVVDDGSPEPTGPIVDEFRDRLAVRLVAQSRAGPGAARNAGAAVARGRYLAFVDDDCRPAPDWLAVLAGELQRDDRQLLGGRVENALTGNLYSEASERITEFVYERHRRGQAQEPFFTTSNFALSTERFRSLGGFTTAIPSATAEDKEFCDRWRARGLALTPVPEAVVFHVHHLTLRRFWRQHFNYGRGIFAFRQLRRRRGPGRLVPEAVAFYLGLILSPLRTRKTEGRWRLVALLALSQLATMAGAAREALGAGDLGRRRPAHPVER
jgi:glycosyltransferase involved in cell wall biosynthesis